MGQSELASRLTLNCQNSYVEPHKIRDIPVTIMDVSFPLNKMDAFLFKCACQDLPHDYFIIFQCVSANAALDFFFTLPVFLIPKQSVYWLSYIFPGRNNTIEIGINFNRYGGP